MRLLDWHHAFYACTDLDELRSCWHAVAQEYGLHPVHAPAAYQDALLSFIATSTLPAQRKLGALLTCVDGADFDLRLALGALDDAFDAAGSPAGGRWRTPIDIGAPLSGPGVGFDSTDAALNAFALGRLTGLRDTLRQDGKSAAAWRLAFWNAYFALACRWADEDALALALRHGATLEQGGAAVLRVLAEGVHAHGLHPPYYNAGRHDDDYVAVLDCLRARGLDIRRSSGVMLPAAAAVDNAAMIESLVARGADLGAAGERALTAAASNFAHGAAEWLLGYGVDVHGSGDAALVGAVAALDETMVDILLEAGANVHADNELPLRTAFAARPVDLYDGATEFVYGRADMVAVLLRHGANPTHPAVIAALQDAIDGEAVLYVVLQRDHLEPARRHALEAAGAAAFGW